MKDLSEDMKLLGPGGCGQTVRRHQEGDLQKSERLRSRAELSEGRLHQANAPSFHPPFAFQADSGALEFHDAAVRTEPRTGVRI